MGALIRWANPRLSNGNKPMGINWGYTIRWRHDTRWGRLYIRWRLHNNEESHWRHVQELVEEYWATTSRYTLRIHNTLIAWYCLEVRDTLSLSRSRSQSSPSKIQSLKYRRLGALQDRWNKYMAPKGILLRVTKFGIEPIYCIPPLSTLQLFMNPNVIGK